MQNLHRILLKINRSISTNISGTKTIETVVTSLRIDRILATGLSISRRKIEYSLLRGCVKLNGKVVTKKSIEIKSGDIVDKFIIEQTTESHFTVGRVKLVEIGETTKKGNYKIELERTKLLSIAKIEYTDSLSNEFA